MIGNIRFFSGKLLQYSEISDRKGFFFIETSVSLSDSIWTFSECEQGVKNEPKSHPSILFSGKFPQKTRPLGRNTQQNECEYVRFSNFL